jgi:type VI secretion system protein ImpG
MSEELVPYYNRELSYIRRLGAEFAQAHPKIAARLVLGPHGTEDPHVERLIEAFAYLNARIRHKLDDDFPEITDAMLGVVYPHYQVPIPSMAIVQLVLDRGQADLVGGYTIPRESMLEADWPDGEPCRFRTCYPVTLFPIEVASASLTGRPYAAPAVGGAGDAVAVLRIQLQSYSKDMAFSRLAAGSLRFYLNGQSQHVFALYELLLNNALAVAVASSPRDPQPVVLPPQSIRPVGFERDEGMLPYTARSFLGYRLLTEYFTFPQKFLFFELAGLGPKVLKATGTLEFFFYLNRSTLDLEQNVSADTFRLGCTPIINLYSRRAEPIALTQTETEYRVVPDARHPLAGEVYSIDRVTATSPDGEQVEFQPFYSLKHAAAGDPGTIGTMVAVGSAASVGSRPSVGAPHKAFWHATRRPAAEPGAKGDRGTEVWLSLVDLAFSPAAPPHWTLDVETTCLDRDRPSRLPFGEGQPVLRLTKGAPLSRIACLTRPTPTLRPALKHGALWRLISHLSLNHLSLADSQEGADALREILKLYDFADSAETRAMIDGLLSVRTRRVVGRAAGEPRGGFCRGLEVTVLFDEDRFAGSGVYLFACVLERFLGLYCSINSFSKMIATTNKREGELRRWPPRAGEIVLL